MAHHSIIGELKEFKRATLNELREIKGDIQDLKKFKWKFDGQITVLVVLVSIVTSLIGVWLSK